MKYRLWLFALMFPLTCMAFAEEDQGRLFWVVGSFADQAVAMGEGEKISQVTGLDVLYVTSDVNGTTYYRLLVPQFEDEDDRSRVKAQLGYAGIDKPWPLRLDDTLTMHLSSVVAQQKSLYLVLGSFDKYEDAQRQVDTILESFNQIAELREFTVDGESVIRVMTGPYVDQAEAEIARELIRGGEIDDAWLIKLSSQYQDMMSEYESSLDVDYYDMPVSRPDRDLMLREATRKSARAPENTIRPGYNLARLKKRPAD